MSVVVSDPVKMCDMYLPSDTSQGLNFSLVSSSANLAFAAVAVKFFTEMSSS